MEKRVGIGFPKFACEIRKNRDMYKCIKNNSICSDIKNRHAKCLTVETKKLKASNKNVERGWEKIKKEQIVNEK